MAKCAVCGKAVNEDMAPAKTTHDGQTYYLCSEACEKKFEANRGRYAKSA